MRLTIDLDTASCIEEALDYHLAASSDNFGSGWEGEDPDDRRTLMEERSIVADFAYRVRLARERASSRG